MTNQSIDVSRRKAARIAGLAYLLTLVTVVVVNYGVFVPLVSGTDPAQAARNILAHEALFRVGLAGFVSYCFAVVVLSSSIYVVLRPVNANLALLATLARLIDGLTWLLITINLFTALRLLSRPEYAGAFGSDQLPVLAKLYLTGYDHYYVGLLFWCLGSAIGAWLWLRSGYVPRALAIYGILASGWGAACTFVLFLFPDFPRFVSLTWFDMPMVLFEISLGLFLVVRGLRPPVRPTVASPVVTTAPLGV